MTRRQIVAVIGDGDASADSVVLAESVGRGLIDAGYRIVTGGLGGVMEAASRGARASEHYRDGDVIGIIPGEEKDSANAWVDIVVVSGLGIARNAVIARTADALIAIGGGSGTLSEMAMGWQLGKPIIALGSAGWSGRLGGASIDARRRDSVLAARDPDHAVALVKRALVLP